jgi:hypothetical protein
MIWGLNKSVGFSSVWSLYVMIMIGKNHTRGIGSLNLARYILNEVRDNENYFDNSSISKKSDNNEIFVGSITGFLKDMEWLSEDKYGKYITTQEGLKNNLDNLIF